MIAYLINAIFWFIVGAISITVFAVRKGMKEDGITMKEVVNKDQKKWTEEDIRKNFR